jgi:hypothetical protein
MTCRDGGGLCKRTVAKYKQGRGAAASCRKLRTHDVAYGRRCDVGSSKSHKSLALKSSGHLRGRLGIILHTYVRH